jgi:hypothetical protein
MIATLCNEEFSHLYQLTANQMEKERGLSKILIKQYSDLKASIFLRYRTLSELLGIVLLNEAQERQISCMMETSGRDVAMFKYIDEFFPTGYNKLALHFVINDLTCAQESVDRRMEEEIKMGVAAIQADDVLRIVDANAGGPYGSEVLPDVQEASDRVWNDIVLKDDGVGLDWYKATICINAHPTMPWTAQAILRDGKLGTIYTFQKR